MACREKKQHFIVNHRSRLDANYNYNRFLIQNIKKGFACKCNLNSELLTVALLPHAYILELF